MMWRMAKRLSTTAHDQVPIDRLHPLWVEAGTVKVDKPHLAIFIENDIAGVDVHVAEYQFVPATRFVYGGGHVVRTDGVTEQCLHLKSIVELGGTVGELPEYSLRRHFRDKWNLAKLANI